MDIQDIIKAKHNGDEAQLGAIFSNDLRIMMVAPAGCGKTKTLISKICFVLSQKCSELKYGKMLALTFSVNAAFKMKKDIYEFCPSILGTSLDIIKKKITISNYHGFARAVLSKYGYLLDERLRKINEILPLDEKKVIEQKNCNLNENEKNFLLEFSKNVTNCDRGFIDSNIEEYFNLLIKLLDINVITYNSYLVYLIVLFERYPKLLLFYKKIYPYILIDEFQDTNYLSWKIINFLIDESSHLFFMGDKLQRIYGFIGAIPDLLDEAINSLSMTVINLNKNYRFKDNKNMLLLDRNIRRNAEGIKVPNDDLSEIQLKRFDTINDEINFAKRLIERTNELNSKLAILVQSRSRNLECMLNKFEKEKIDYFYALFSEDDSEYIEYHINASRILADYYLTGCKISKSFLNKLFISIEKYYEGNNNVIIKSLLDLTRLFFDRIFIDYSFLTDLEKLSLISDSFLSRSLKQNMDLVEKNVIVSTIHGAKGLEWDYVLIPSCIDYTIPNYPSLCQFCNPQRINGFCYANILAGHEKEYLEQLSVFYVGVTRAKKELVFTAPKERINKYGDVKNSNISCMLTLNGIKIKNNF